MGFFNSKEDMFKHRADRFKREGQEAARRGNIEKSNWCKEQEEANREKVKNIRDKKAGNNKNII